MGRQGFPYAQLESGFLADPKFRRLGRLLPDPVDFLAAIGVFTIMVAASWREASREPSIAEEFEEAPDPLILALVGAHLLTEEGCVTERAFQRWVGAALQRRAEEAARKRRSTSDSNGVQPKAGESEDSTYLLTNLPDSPHATEEGVKGEKPTAIETYYRLTTKWPTKGALGWLNRLMDTHDDDDVSKALAEEWTASSDVSTLLSRTEAHLGQSIMLRQVREAEDRNLAKKRNLAEQRRLIEEEPAISKEAAKAAMDAIRKGLADRGAL